MPINFDIFSIDNKYSTSSGVCYLMWKKQMSPNIPEHCFYEELITRCVLLCISLSDYVIAKIDMICMSCQINNSSFGLKYCN